MTDCVQFFNADGTRVERFPVFAPQYKVLRAVDGSYLWYRLTKDDTYEKQGRGTYQDVLYAMLVDSRRVNAKKHKFNWHLKAALEEGPTLFEAGLKEGQEGTCMYLTIDSRPCQTPEVAAWRVVKEAKDWFSVYRPVDTDIWVKVYEEQLYTCRQFIDDQRKGIRDRLVELYRCNRGIQLYRYVAMLHELDTMSVFVGVTVAKCVEEAINYTDSWTSKAIRIGSRCVSKDGRSTCLARPKGCIVDWNVTQLSHLCRLSADEVRWLVDHGYISPIMSGDEVWGVVKEYLEDPDRKLMRAFKESCAGSPE